jgi:hypothetical protein
MKMVPEEYPTMHYIVDAADLLESCSKEDFETVLVLGFKDGTIYLRNSAYVNTLEIIGALETAKHMFLESRGEDDDANN